MTQREPVLSEEIDRSQARVGLTPKARLQWALDFARKDLDTLTVGDWANLQREFLAFTDFLITPDAVDAPWVREALSLMPVSVIGPSKAVDVPWSRGSLVDGARLVERGRVASMGDPPARQPARSGSGSTKKRASREIERGAPMVSYQTLVPSPRVLPSSDALREVQQQWRALVNPLLLPDGEVLEIGPLSVRLSVQRHDDLGRTRMGVFPQRDEAGRLQLTNLLGAYAHLLRECPEPACCRWFVSSRRGQTFCGRTCQNRAAIRAHRARAQARKRAPKRKRR